MKAIGRVVQEWRSKDSMKALLTVFGHLSIYYSPILVSGLRPLSIYYLLVFGVRFKMNGVGSSISIVVMWLWKERKVEGLKEAGEGRHVDHFNVVEVGRYTTIILGRCPGSLSIVCPVTLANPWSQVAC